ncbi:MCM2/3/5 family domain-containing protein [Phthorimaea operculella]|nr:MCM2/3/5 family domain-containing protein [Phthorimaea operculella]
MEQQTLSVAKAGIICQLNARTSILAAANPAESQWNKNKTIVENVQLPHTLMSREREIQPQHDARVRSPAISPLGRLYQVMEQQTLSVAKAGIICQLNARTSILAAANPAESQWNKNKTIVENVQLPHTLMSRQRVAALLVEDYTLGRSLPWNFCPAAWRTTLVPGSPSRCLEDNPGSWRPIPLPGGQPRFLEAHPAAWRTTPVPGGPSRCLEDNPGSWRPIPLPGGQPRFLEAHPAAWRTTPVPGGPSRCLEDNPGSWRPIPLPGGQPRFLEAHPAAWRTTPVPGSPSRCLEDDHPRTTAARQITFLSAGRSPSYNKAEETISPPLIPLLESRTSILAAANPAESQWNKNKTIVENVQLPHTLMSRFDLIFLVLDPQDEVFDRRLASHLVSLYYKDFVDSQKDDDIVDMSLMRDYIAFAKEHIHPTLSEQAQQRLIDAYVDMRRVGSGRGQISAYPRQLESLIRLAEAHARMRLSNTVELSDVDEAARLHREALKQSATDPASGRIDVGILTTGLGAAARRRRADLVQALKQKIQPMNKPATITHSKLLHEINADSQITVSREQLDEALRDLQDEGKVTIISSTHIRIC